MDRTSLSDFAEMMLIEVRVAEFLPGFQDRVREALKILLGEEGAARVRMGLAKDGSGVGGMSCFLSYSQRFPSPPFLYIHIPRVTVRSDTNDQPHLPPYKPKRHWINVPRTRRRKGAKKFQVRKNRIVPRGNQFDFRNDMHV
jgi:hypothetical protein